MANISSAPPPNETEHIIIDHVIIEKRVAALSGRTLSERNLWMVTHIRVKPEGQIHGRTSRNHEVTRVRNLTRLIEGSSHAIKTCE
jgi:hypothetical protein